MNKTKVGDIEVGQVYFNQYADEDFTVMDVADKSIEVKYNTDIRSKVIETTLFVYRVADGVFKLKSNKKTQPSKQIDFIHEQSFTCQTGRDIPDFMTLKAHDAGESWVRRNTRAWPHNKKLSTQCFSVVNDKFPRETIHTIKWFWEDNE